MKNNRLYCYALLSATLSVISVPALADDTEIYTGSAESVGDPNVIFLFDTSGSMQNGATGPDGSYSSRIEVSKMAAESIISGLSNINIGIMQFDSTRSGTSPVNHASVYRDSSNSSDVNRDYGGFVLVPVDSINDDKHKSDIITAIDGLEANAYTPLVESYDEAARYLRGESVKYGRRYGPVSCGLHEQPVTPKTITTYEQVCIEYRYNNRTYSGEDNGSGWGSGWGWGGWGGSSNPYCEESGTVYLENYDYYHSSYNQCYRWDNEIVQNGQCTSIAYLRTETVTNPGETQTVNSCERTDQNQYFYISHPDSIDTSTGKYKSPITDSCQSNHIIVFTDGSSTMDNESDSRIHSMIGEINRSEWSSLSGMSSNCATSNRNAISADNCMEELSYYLYHTDNRRDSDLEVDTNSGAESDQKIITHTVGGFMDDGSIAQQLLNRVATYGGGIAATASNYDELIEALMDVFTEISSSSGSFTAPSVAVNALNRLENSEELYYSVFQPSSSIYWGGNLKRYRLGSDGRIYDKNGVLAVDSETGFFADNARSFWTLQAAAPDGDKVTVGGASSRLPAQRKVLTHLNGDGSTLSSGLIAGTAGNYRVGDDINQTLFGTSMTDNEFLNMLKWASGIDVSAGNDTTSRYQIEDPLHSQPVILHYGVMSDGKTLDSTIFFGTNSGYLHAIDSNENNPQERFAFIPKEMLPNVYQYYRLGNTGGKVYGMDGPISYYTVDNGANDTVGIIDNDDKAYLFVGMRRGGKSYYALDVSDRNSPKLMWEIHGGSGDFAELGQSWSKMVPININPAVLGINSSERTIKVLVFGGGYDPDEDNTNTPSGSRITHDEGNAIFIVDALTGELLWKASSRSGADLRIADMTSGIVGEITPVDNDGDGDVDILYAADLGGRIWRIDLFSNGTQQATKLADLNSGNTAGNVRFYTSVNVSYSEGVDNNGRYRIALGSGYRAHPLDENVQDNFYIINDFMVEENESSLRTELNSYTTLTKSDLANFSNYSSVSNTLRHNGVYIPLPGNNEKVLSDSITADDVVYFTTYIPEDTSNASTSCTVSTGGASLYSLTVNGEAIDTDEPDDNHVKPEGDIILKKTGLKQSGIPASPVLVFPPSDTNNGAGGCDSKKAIIVGAESISLDECVSLDRNYWHEL